MKRADLEHVLRAAAGITGRREWVVVGSQAILGAHPDAAAELLVSQEADLYSPEEESASDIVDGTIGELSPFHESFGYYAHGVGPETAVLPSGWRSRAVIIETSGPGSAIGICPEPCDLAISKIVAWREKDRDFVAALLRHGLVTPEGLRSRIRELPAAVAEMVAVRVEQIPPG
jgi:hypothetical protein